MRLIKILLDNSSSMGEPTSPASHGSRRGNAPLQAYLKELKRRRREELATNPEAEPIMVSVDTFLGTLTDFTDIKDLELPYNYNNRYAEQGNTPLYTSLLTVIKATDKYIDSLEIGNKPPVLVVLITDAESNITETDRTLVNLVQEKTQQGWAFAVLQVAGQTDGYRNQLLGVLGVTEETTKVEELAGMTKVWLNTPKVDSSGKFIRPPAPKVLPRV